MLEKLKLRAREIKQGVRALYYAYQDERTPLYAKAWALFVLLYALSPIDLIPDFIPVLGYLDDVILLPLGVMLAVRLIPAEVMASARLRVANSGEEMKRLEKFGAWMIVSIWGIALGVGVRLLLN